MASPVKHRYLRVIRAVMSIPWAILPSRLCDIMDLLAFKAAGGELSAEEIAEYVGHRGSDGGTFCYDAEPQALLTQRDVQARTSRADGPGGVVAVIPIRGILANRIEGMDALSGPGGTSVELLTERFRSAMNDPRVRGIVLDVDSPGGAVDGVPELAAEIFDARGRKPMMAVANTMAASAAYWIATAADEISVTPSGEVGSIGVFAAHSDVSAKLEREGEKVTLVHAGKYKVEANPFESLSDEARASIQSRVNDVYGMFVQAVANGRGASSKDVRNGFGEGRTVGADEAVRLGMADRVETRDAAIARMRESLQGNARRAGRSAREFAFVPSR